MRSLEELIQLLIEHSDGSVVSLVKIGKFMRLNAWNLLWEILKSTTLSIEPIDFLSQAKTSICHGEQSATQNLQRTPVNMDRVFLKDLWIENIFRWLTLKERGQLSLVYKFFYHCNIDLINLKLEFPEYFAQCVAENHPIQAANVLSKLRALAYGQGHEKIGLIFRAIAQDNLSQLISVSEQIAVDNENWMFWQRAAVISPQLLLISPIVLAIILDRFTLLIYLLSRMRDVSRFSHADTLKLACQYGASTIVKALLTAYSEETAFEFDPYLSIACEKRHFDCVSLLASRVKPATLNRCLEISALDPKAERIIRCLLEKGATLSNALDPVSKTLSYCSELVKEICKRDLAITLSIFLNHWGMKYEEILFGNACSLGRYKPEDLSPNVVALLLSRNTKRQCESRSQFDFKFFLKRITESEQLHLFLLTHCQHWNTRLRASTVHLMIEMICAAGLVNNFTVLLEYGVDINLEFTTSVGQLTSPLGLAAYHYKTSQNLLQFLVEQEAKFTVISACNAVERGDVSALADLMRMPNASLSTTTLDNHPLLVAAQFARLDCFEYLIALGYRLERFTPELLFELLIQGPIAGLLSLRPRIEHPVSWLTDLFKHRQKFLTLIQRREVGNLFGFEEGDPSLYPQFLNAKADLYLNIVKLILPHLQSELHQNKIILPIAASTANESLVRLVLCYSPAIDAQDAQGNTALFLACLNKQTNIVNVLVNYGARLTILNLQKQSVFQFALKHPPTLVCLMNSAQYAHLKFPDFPNKETCRGCLTYFTEENPINPKLEEFLYHTHRLHPEMQILEQLQLKIREMIVSDKWPERGFGNITIDGKSYRPPTRVADIYKSIIAFYELPYPHCLAALDNMYASISKHLDTHKSCRLFRVSDEMQRLLTDLSKMISNRKIGGQISASSLQHGKKM